MRTVKSLRYELAKFPDDALCYAYEGEVIAVVVQENASELGWVVCDQYDNVNDSQPAKLHPIAAQGEGAST